MAEPYLTHLSQVIDQLGPLSSENVILESKHFFSGGALYANGKICASLSPAGFALKLPEATRVNLLTEGKGSEFRFFPTGPVKVEYVALSAETLEDQELFQDLIDLSICYVAGQLNSSAAL